MARTEGKGTEKRTDADRCLGADGEVHDAAKEECSESRHGGLNSRVRQETVGEEGQVRTRERETTRARVRNVQGRCRVCLAALVLVVEEVAVNGEGGDSDDESEEGCGGDALDGPTDAVLGSTSAVAEFLEEEEEEKRNEGRLEGSMQDGSASNEVLDHPPDEDRD